MSVVVSDCVAVRFASPTMDVAVPTLAADVAVVEVLVPFCVYGETYLRGVRDALYWYGRAVERGDAEAAGFHLAEAVGSARRRGVVIP